VSAPIVVPGDGEDRTTSRGRAPQRMRAGVCRATRGMLGFLGSWYPWRVRPRLEHGSCTCALRIHTTGSLGDCHRIRKVWKREPSWHPSGPRTPGDARDAGRVDARRLRRLPPRAAPHLFACSHPRWLGPRRPPIQQDLSQGPDMLGCHHPGGHRSDTAGHSLAPTRGSPDARCGGPSPGYGCRPRPPPATSSSGPSPSRPRRVNALDAGWPPHHCSHQLCRRAARRTTHRVVTAPGGEHRGKRQQKRAAARRLRPTTAAPCWGDLEDPSRGMDPQACSPTCQDAHAELDRGLFAGEKRAMRLQKVALACRAGALPPGATTGMAVGPEIAKAKPAPIGTMAVRTQVPGGVDLTGSPVRRGPGGGRYRRGRLGMRGISLTQGTLRLVR
jgi:hypothetical protein